MDGSRGEKADIITYALESSNIEDKSQAVMIGDRKYDVLGAKKIGVDSIGVLYGYGDLEELKEDKFSILDKIKADYTLQQHSTVNRDTLNMYSALGDTLE